MLLFCEYVFGFVVQCQWGNFYLRNFDDGVYRFVLDLPFEEFAGLLFEVIPDLRLQLFEGIEALSYGIGKLVIQVGQNFLLDLGDDDFELGCFASCIFIRIIVRQDE